MICGHGQCGRSHATPPTAEPTGIGGGHCAWEPDGYAASFHAPSTTATMSRMICVRSKSLGV
jgi:hypothetical protein